MAHSPIFRAADIQWTGLIGWHGIIPTFSVGVAIGLASFSAVNWRSKKMLYQIAGMNSMNVGAHHSRNFH